MARPRKIAANEGGQPHFVFHIEDGCHGGPLR